MQPDYQNMHVKVRAPPELQVCNLPSSEFNPGCTKCHQSSSSIMGLFGCRPRLDVPARQLISAPGDQNRTPGNAAWRRSCLGGSIQTACICIGSFSSLTPLVRASELMPLRGRVCSRQPLQDPIPYKTKNELASC